MDLKQEIVQKEAELQKVVDEYNKISEVRNNLTNKIIKLQGTLEYLQQKMAPAKPAEASKDAEKK